MYDGWSFLERTCTSKESRVLSTISGGTNANWTSRERHHGRLALFGEAAVRFVLVLFL
jgi:hypothetical protein